MSFFADELVGLLIHADDRTLRIISLFIDVQNILHTGNKGSIVLRSYDPAFFEVRLEFVFFRS